MALIRLRDLLKRKAGEEEQAKQAKKPRLDLKIKLKRGELLAFPPKIRRSTASPTSAGSAQSASSPRTETDHPTSTPPTTDTASTSSAARTKRRRQEEVEGERVERWETAGRSQGSEGAASVASPDRSAADEHINKRAKIEADSLSEEHKPYASDRGATTSVGPQAGDLASEADSQKSPLPTGGPSAPTLKRKLEKILDVGSGNGAGAAESLRAKRRKVAGLVNPRFRCFINASVQCLASLPEFMDYALAQAASTSPGSWSGNISPSEGVATPSLEGGQGTGSRRGRRGEDVHAEKLRRALEKVDPDLLDMSREFAGLVNDLYHEPGHSHSTPLAKLVATKAKSAKAKPPKRKPAKEPKTTPAVDGVGFATAFGCLFPEFDGNSQQDCMEFLTHLFTRIRQEDASHRRPSFIKTAFEARILHSMQCNSCHQEWDNEEDFSEMGVNFPHQSVQTATKPPPLVSIDDCLAMAFSKQPMTDYECRHCGKPGTTVKTDRLVHLPNNLVMQIKRFSQEIMLKKHKNGVVSAGSRTNKIDYRLRYGERLNFKSFFSTQAQETNQDQDQDFELMAILTHDGAKPTVGHYYAHAQRDGQWYLLNDQRVKPVTFKQVLDTAQPYLMFWKRKVPIKNPIDGSSQADDLTSLHSHSPESEAQSSSAAQAKPNGISKSEPSQ